MCSHCGTIRNYRKLITDNFDKIKERKEELETRTEEDYKSGGFDSCNSTEILLLQDILFILRYIGAIDEVEAL